MIYFMQPVGGGPVKIGFSGDVEYRRGQLETIYGKPMVVLATMEGGRDEERELHLRFSHLRFGRTEQFRPTAELMAFIGRPLLVDANPSAVEAIPAALDRNKPIIAALRGSSEFRRFLERAASKDRSTLAAFLERAAVRYAKAIGVTDEPPDR